MELISFFRIVRNNLRYSFNIPVSVNIYFHMYIKSDGFHYLFPSYLLITEYAGGKQAVSHIFNQTVRCLCMMCKQGK